MAFKIALQTDSGWMPFRLISAASTNATLVKATPGQVGMIHAYNSGAGAAFLKMYDTAVTPTAGAGTPKATYAIPAGGVFTRSVASIGTQYNSGIGFTITGGSGDSDTTTVAAGAVIVNLDTN